jgi:hypothetical protein
MPVTSTARPPNGGHSPHDDFLALLPVVERHARVAFRDLDVEAHEEAAAEAVAAAFEAHVTLKARDRNPAGFPSALATYSVLHVLDGRHVGGRSSSCDVLSRKAQRLRGFRVEPLPASTRAAFESVYARIRGQQKSDALEEHLRDNTQTPVPEQVAFRLDFPAFLQTLTERNRQMALAMAEGHAARRVAERFGLSPGRVTQLRQQWQRAWLLFQGEAEELTADARLD